MVQVKSKHDSQAAAHIARVIAVDGQDQVLILPLENGPSPHGVQVDLLQSSEAALTLPTTLTGHSDVTS